MLRALALLFLAAAAHADTLSQAAARHVVEYALKWTPFQGAVSVVCNPAANYLGQTYQATGAAGLVDVYVTEGSIDCLLTATNSAGAVSTASLMFDYPNPVVIIRNATPNAPSNLLVAQAR